MRHQSSMARPAMLNNRKMLTSDSVQGGGAIFAARMGHVPHPPRSTGDGRPSRKRMRSMIKTIASALVAASLLAAPAFAQGTAPTATAPAAVQQTKAPVKHKHVMKSHRAKKHVAMKHRHRTVKKHVALKHRTHVKHVKQHAKTLKHQASHAKHHVKKAGCSPV